ncbi:hypothetical protein GCM10025795_45270 [Verticiella sediminum]
MLESVASTGHTSQGAAAAANLYKHFNALRTITENINHRSFFKALESLQEGLNALKTGWPDGVEPIHEISHATEILADLYDKYLAKQSALNAYPLIFSAQKLHSEIEAFLRTLRAVRTSIEQAHRAGSIEAEFLLVLQKGSSLVILAGQLRALQAIYSELCALFSVSEIEYPLRIGKIESGSLWVQLFGHTKIVETMAAFISNAVAWIYRNYTDEGRISRLPQRADAVDAILTLSQRMKEQGIDVSEMEPNLKKAAVGLSKDLSELLCNQPSITINHRTLSLREELTKATLEGSEARRLGMQDSRESGLSSMFPNENQDG